MTEKKRSSTARKDSPEDIRHLVTDVAADWGPKQLLGVWGNILIFNLR